MEIPKQFELGGQTITVEYDNKLFKNNDSTGQARFRDNTIILQSSVEGFERNEDQQRHSFYHELVHWILYIMGNDLYNDEKFVELFSQLLRQYEKTKNSDLE